MNGAGGGRGWISRIPGTIGVFPFPGSHRELAVIAPRSIFNSSLCIVAVRKESAGTADRWDGELSSLGDAEMSWKNFHPPGQQRGRIPELMCAPGEREPLLRCSLPLQFLTRNLLECLGVPFPIDSHVRQFHFPPFKLSYVG